MRADTELDLLYRAAAAATARGSRSFYFASRFFHREMASGAHAVYWFCRHTDDLVDEAPDPDQGRRDLEAWERDLRSALAGDCSEHPVLRLFLDAVRRHNIPHEYPLELIEGMRMDADGTRYPDFPTLRRFCYRVASVVGLMMSRVIGCRGAAENYAIDLGIAMQLTNILRDVGEDLDRDRVYLPADDMAACGYSEDLLRARVRNGAFRRLMRMEAGRARCYYERAEPGIELLDPRGRFAVQTAARVYREILSQIEKSDYDVFERRAVVPAWRKHWIAARLAALPAVRRSARSLAVWRTEAER